MQNMMDKLSDLIKEDERIFVNGKILKNKLTELALKLDEKLIGLLLTNKKTKEHFFVSMESEHGTILVFDKDKFISFINNKEFLPDSFTSFKNRIGLMAKGEFLKEKDDISLVWPYKDCILEGGQDKEDQKRNEIFYNETLAPDEIDRLFEEKVFTNFRRIDKEGEHKVKHLDDKDNLIIKGNNLLSLHSLKKIYLGRVKLIYIDPPYNKGDDSFKYNDRFNHSTWLTFMKNRLEVAKNLMKKDGVIFISIDDTEFHYLKVLADEIFGRNNYISTVVVQNNPKGRVMDKNFATSHEYLLIYSKGSLEDELTVPKTEEEILREYPDKDDRGNFRLLELRNTHRQFGKHNRPNLFFPLYINPKDLSISTKRTTAHPVEVKPIWDDGFDGCWTWNQAKCEIENELLVGKEINGKWKVFRKAYAQDASGNLVSKKLKTIWLKKEFHTEKGQKTINELIGIGKFYAPKPVEYIKTIIKLATDSHSHDIVLDFFAGSGTIAQAVLELNYEDKGNRQFIICEQLDYVNLVTIPRIKKVIKKLRYGSADYMELKEWNQKYINAIEKTKTTKELKDLYESMRQEAFFRHDIDFSKFDKKEFSELLIDEQKQILIECLDKNHLYVNYSEIDDSTYKISADDKKLNRDFYKARL